MGCGTQRGYVEYVRGHEVDINMLPKIKFEIVVSDEKWEEKTISAIQKAAYTGHPGDGKIFSYDLKSAMRIRTKELAMMLFSQKMMKINIKKWLSI